MTQSDPHEQEDSDPWNPMAAREAETPGTALSVLMLFGSLCLVFAVAAVGASVTASSVNDWYPALFKPALTPPPWVFPIAWNLLYFMMALAAWLVWLKSGSLLAAGAPLSLFGSQLMLNLGWSVLFFGLRAPGIALAEISVLLLLIALTTLIFFRRSTLAGILMLPYLAWVGFATYLNAGIWLLNG